MTTISPADRRQDLQLREVLDNAYPLVEPFLDTANSWGGQTLEHLAFRVMRERFPQVSGEQIQIFVAAAKRIYHQRHLQH